MSFIKRLIITVLSVGLASSVAFSEESGKKRLPGKVVVASVLGKVEAFDPRNQTPRSLKQNDVISEKHTVTVGQTSTVTLVFSNGSTISLLENSELVISEFLQDPFSTPYAMATATEEPTTSVTSLNLVEGEVVCNVKKLRVKEGSSLVVNTPVGAAGVRGTIFVVKYTTDENGNAIYTLSVTEGEVSLTDSNGQVTLIAAGKEVVVSVTLSVDPVTGETTVAEVLSMEVQDIPAARLAMINQVVADGATAVETIIVGVTEANLIDVLTQALDAPPVVIDPQPTTDVNPR
ncbi:MAG: FecR domain-containing protein [Akkermansiaceae bacterium]